jgi:hypothetical protein
LATDGLIVTLTITARSDRLIIMHQPDFPFARTNCA